MFDIVWHGDGTASIKAANDKYIVPKGTGSMYATSDSVTDKEKFKVKIVNRPLLVLKSDFGFVGAKNPNAEVWEFNCNKVTHDVLFLTPSDNGTYTLKGMVVICFMKCLNFRIGMFQHDVILSFKLQMFIPIMVLLYNPRHLPFKEPSEVHPKLYHLMNTL